MSTEHDADRKLHDDLDQLVTQRPPGWDATADSLILGRFYEESRAAMVHAHMKKLDIGAPMTVAAFIDDINERKKKLVEALDLVAVIQDGMTNGRIKGADLVEGRRRLIEMMRTIAD